MFLRINPRDADDLQWRFLYSEGDIKGVRARAYDESILLPMEHPSELRCGDIFVPSASHDSPCYEMSERQVDAVARQRRVDLCLTLCTLETRRVLWLAYGAPVDVRMFPLNRAPAVDHDHTAPALCNLMDVAPSNFEFYQRTRTVYAFRDWLNNLADGLSKGRTSDDTARTLRRGAEKCFLKAAREYGAASTTLRKGATQAQRRAQ